MKKLYTLILVTLFSNIIYAQSGEKIKGNKILEVKTIEIEPYKILEIGENFDVVLVKQEVPRVRVETDSNLQEFVKIDVTAEKLRIQTSETISRFKKMYLEIGYTKELAQIIASGKVAIRGNTALNTERTELDISESANVNLNFESSIVEIKGSGKSKITTSVLAESVALHLSKNVSMLASINTESLNANLSESCKLTVSGSTPNANFFLQDNSYLSAAKLNLGIANFSTKGTSDAYIKVNDKLSLNAAESSETYLMGNPLIEITAFNDLSKLQKIKKAPSNGFSRLLK